MIHIIALVTVTVSPYIAPHHAVLDVDECVDKTHNCDEHATCSNTIGSFTCMCDTGYDGAGYNGTCKSM